MNSKTTIVLAIGVYTLMSMFSYSAFGQGWVEDFDNGVGRFDQTLVQGDSLFNWDPQTQSIAAEFRRPAASDRRATILSCEYDSGDDFGFSAVITPLERNDDLLIAVEGRIGFFNELDHNGNNSLGIEIKDDAPVFRLFYPGVAEGTGQIAWDRHQTYFIDFQYNGSTSAISCDIYLGTSIAGSYLGSLEEVVPETFLVNQAGIGSKGTSYTNPNVVDAYLRASIDYFTFTASSEADLTGDGVLNFFDVSVFLTYFQLGDLTADFNADGELNFFDVSEFLSAFQSGCP